MASVDNQLKFDFTHGGGTARFPPSSMQFNWRDDPAIPVLRQFTRQRLAIFLAKSATGEFGQEIDNLSAEFESIIFSAAVSKEDYCNEEALFEWLWILVQDKLLLNISAQQQVANSTSSIFPPFPVAPFIEAPNINSSKSFPGFGMAGSTAFNTMTANCYSGLHSSPGSQTNDCKVGVPAARGRKRTSWMTSSSPNQVTSNISFPGELDSIVPTKWNSSFSQSPFTLDESLETLDGSDVQAQMMCSPSRATSKGYSHLPIRVSQQFEEHSEPVLPSDEPSTGKFKGSLKYQVQDNNAVAVQCNGESIPPSTSDSCGLSSITDDQSQKSVHKILFSYIKFKCLPATRELGQVPFLHYLHSRMCNQKCACQQFKSLLYHFDSCASIRCHICGPPLFRLKEELKLESMNSSSHRQESQGNVGSEDTPPTNSEGFPGPSKCRKLNSFGSEEVLFSRAHPVSPKVSPNSKQCSGPPLSSDSDDAKLIVEIDANKTKNSTCIGGFKNDYIGNEQKLESSNAFSNSEDSVDGAENETEPARGCEVKDKISGNSSFPSFKDEADISKHDFFAQHEDMELRNNTKRAELSSTQGLIEHKSHSEAFVKTEKLKMQGVSLTEFFTAAEVKQHMWSLRQNNDQIAAKREISSTSDNFCQLCNSDKLWFPPLPIYCSACGSRIKYRGTYYSMLDDTGAQFCLCSACYNKSRGGNKSKMEMKKNDVITEEAWVQCDKCEGWQHQICALFNDKRDFSGKAEYICPKCYLEELEAGERNPLPWTTCFDASNLPHTMLSDHLEQRLVRQLKQEREDRAKANAKNLDEVPEATDLVVRVVSSVDKILKVKQQFLDIFPDKNYPAEFPYRSKVILLFQKIEGVDVCLFALYVQEFGSECSRPNQRCIYISYLDSVKYFRPETRTISGEALRTYVYHEILIGYLEYCKKRGFSTCYIWACPPVKGEDYILYCHPEVQKTPKPDKLRQWYQSMLRKAAKEKIMVNFTNIYEQFFVPNEGCNTKVTAARLPYFDGDYWSSVSEIMIKKIEQECGGDLQKKVKKITRRSLKAMGHSNPSDGDEKDILFMQELGQNISSAKEDFILVHLQFVCTQCHEIIASGRRWYCNLCRNFQLCEGCHGADPDLEHSHISSSGQKHELYEEVINDAPADTEDNDAIMNNCFLENRHALLSFCRGNHYQFDTLRHAKHSSMMILYHLHHPIVATSGSASCSLCLRDIGADPRWKCELCPEFTVCSACYQRNSIGCHTHNLSQHSPEANPRRERKMADMIKELLNAVLHASKCHSTRSQPCNYPNCLSIRRLFSHAHSCNIRVGKGCPHCKKVWHLLIMHSRNCGDLNCDVPRCRDLKGLGERRDSRNETRPPETKPEADLSRVQ